jgi:hypothetical protein
MADGFVQVPADSAGKRIAQQYQQRGGVDVFFQEVLTSYPCSQISSGVFVSRTSAQVFPANPARRALILQNPSTTRIVCKFGATPSATAGSEDGFAVEANGGSFGNITYNDQRALFAIHAHSDPTVSSVRLLITEYA